MQSARFRGTVRLMFRATCTNWAINISPELLLILWSQAGNFFFGDAGSHSIEPGQHNAGECLRENCVCGFRDRLGIYIYIYK